MRIYRCKDPRADMGITKRPSSPNSTEGKTHAKEKMQKILLDNVFQGVYKNIGLTELTG